MYKLFLVLLIFSAVCENIPLELEIGVVRISGGVNRQVQVSEFVTKDVRFENTFSMIPKVAIASLIEGMHFAKIRNITVEGFELELLRRSIIDLEYRYIALVDDRVQIICGSFKSKAEVFIPFRNYNRIPRVAVFVTGSETGKATFERIEPSSNGVALSSQQTGLIGVCVIAGSIDALSLVEEDAPKFMTPFARIAVLAQSSYLCDRECLLYYRDETSSNRTNLQQNNIHIDNQTSVFNQSVIEVPIQHPKHINLTEIIEYDQSSQEIQINKTSIQPNTSDPIISLEIKHNVTTSQEQKKMKKRKSRKPSQPVNIKQELTGLKNVAYEQTKEYQFDLPEQNSKFIKVEQSEETSKGEQLVELKTIDRAFKLSPKFQEMFDKAKAAVYHKDQNKTDIQSNHQEPKNIEQFSEQTAEIINQTQEVPKEVPKHTNLRTPLQKVNIEVDSLNDLFDQPKVKEHKLLDYVEMANNNPVSLIELRPQTVEQIQTPIIELPTQNYVDKLSQRKSEILVELKEKYRVKKTNEPLDFNLKVQPEFIPPILLEQYKASIASQPVRERKTAIPAQDDSSYEFEKAYVEWTLSGNDK